MAKRRQFTSDFKTEIAAGNLAGSEAGIAVEPPHLRTIAFLPQLTGLILL